MIPPENGVPSEVSQLPFGKRFAANWLRWFVWLIFLGIGLYASQLIVLALHGAIAAGIVIFVTGVLGYIIGGIVIGALVALIAAAVPTLRIFPTTLAWGILRVVVIGSLLGLLANNTALYGVTSRANTNLTSAQGATCFSAYAQAHYQDSLNGCAALASSYLPRLEQMRQTRDESVVLNDAYDMLRITYTMVLDYGKVQEPENAHQAALHCVGWGLMVVAAIDDLDRTHSNARYVTMRSEALRDIQMLDREYPGVLNEERRAFKESLGP